MSACISRHGEYSEHDIDSEHTCTLCGVLDEDAMRANLAALLAENEKLRRACQTLGRIIEQNGRDALDATGLHHVIDETGDGDWAVVWETLCELRPKIDALTAERDRLAATVAAVEALSWELSPADGPRIRAALTEGGAS